MIDKQITPTAVLPKKMVRKEVYRKVSDVLEGYKSRLGKKKFESSLKKFSKVFAKDIIRALNKSVKQKTGPKF